MNDSYIGNYAKPQNEHDLFLMKEFPNVPLSLMRDIYEIHKNMSLEQQEDFYNASINKNWGVYDDKYEIKEVKYDSFKQIEENIKNNEKIESLE